MRTMNNHKQMLLGKNLTNGSSVSGVSLVSNAKTSSPTVLQIATPANIATGEIAMCREDGAILALSGTTFAAPTALSSLDKVYFVQGQGATLPLIKSDMVYKASGSAKGKLYSAGAEQQTYYGYNAITGIGEFDVLDDNSYILRASLKSNFFEYADKPLVVIADFVSNPATNPSTQAEIVYGLTRSFIANSGKYVNIPFKIERVCDNAGTAIGLIGDTIVGSKGDKIVTLTSGGGTLAGIAAGDYIRFGTAVTAPIYKIVSTTVAGGATGTATLDIALQSDVSLLGTTCEYVTAAAIAAGKLGIHLTGIARKFQEGVFRYQKNKWLASISNAGTTPVVEQVIANEGSGLYEQIAEDEWFYQLAEGAFMSNTIQVPPVSFRKNVELTGTYSQIELTHKVGTSGTAILANSEAFKQLKLAINGTTRANSVDVIADAIEAWTGLTSII